MRIIDLNEVAWIRYEEGLSVGSYGPPTLYFYLKGNSRRFVLHEKNAEKFLEKYKDFITENCLVGCVYYKDKVIIKI